MEHQPPDPPVMPEIDLHLFDRVIGVALAVGRVLGRASQQFTHVGLSDYPKHKTLPNGTRMAEVEQNYDGNGSQVV